MSRSETALAGAALGMALIEATSAQARTAPPETMRVSTRNTPAPSGDMYQAGRTLLAAGDVTGAMAAFRQALIEAPKSIDALNALGVCYDRLGRYDISRSYYDSALAIDPDSTLVLNNLGYSLYLQGEYAAAIPILQRAANADDPAVVAASQRVLALVADQMRQVAATSGARAAIAEAEIARTHIELAANGEQRLVFDAAAPDKALVAALGDDAALVTIAGPARSNGRPFRIQTGSMAAQSATLDDAAGQLPTVVYLTTSQPNAERTTTLAMAEDDTDVTAKPEGHVGAAQVKQVGPLALPVTPGFVRTFVAAAPPQRSRPVPLAPRRDDSTPFVLPAGSTVGNNRNRDAAPAWLLSSRRSDLPTTGRPDIGLIPGRHDAVAAFESDLDDLNRFAARMRGGDTAAAGDTDFNRDIAVARLEALIARIRSA